MSPIAQRENILLLKVSVFGALVSLVLCGCTAPVPARLLPTAVDQVGEVLPAVVIEAENVTIEVQASSYGAGLGLVGAIMDAGVESKRKKDAETLIVPLRDKTKDLNVREEFMKTLSPALEELSWPQLLEPRLETKSVPVDMSQVKDRSLLKIRLDYHFSTTAEVFKMKTYYTLYLKGNAKAAVEGATYYSSKRIGKGEENEDAIALWAENDAVAYREAVSQGIGETVKMLCLALPYLGHKSPGQPADKIVKMDVRLRHGRGDYGIKQSGTRLNGWILFESEGRALFLDQSGRFYSFPASDILKKLAS